MSQQRTPLFSRFHVPDGGTMPFCSDNYSAGGIEYGGGSQDRVEPKLTANRGRLRAKFPYLTGLLRAV